MRNAHPHRCAAPSHAPLPRFAYRHAAPHARSAPAPTARCHLPRTTPRAHCPSTCPVLRAALRCGTLTRILLPQTRRARAPQPRTLHTRTFCVQHTGAFSSHHAHLPPRMRCTHARRLIAPPARHLGIARRTSACGACPTAHISEDRRVTARRTRRILRLLVMQHSFRL